MLARMNQTRTAEILREALPELPRPIVLQTRGQTHGAITRLVSPSDVGELIKPFVFLDLAEVEYTGRPLFGIHPHSGIATLTVVLQGGFSYEDTTGKSGKVTAGGLEWMKAGNGVWHDGGPLEGPTLRAFQLWVALPAAEENSSPDSQYIATDAVEQDGPVRVVLGEYGRARSAIRAPRGINYFHVHLKDQEEWTYTPPAGHEIAWLAVDRGGLLTPDAVSAGELAVFADGEDSIFVRAQGDTSFVIGSAIRHPHPLVLGSYSVHTSEAALTQGELEIARIGRQLKASGRL
jgi:redox-sensitive bicupin YhaK (pirin superfamily)